MNIRVEQSADVAGDAVIGRGSSIWHLAQVREGAVLGSSCIVGRGAYVGPGVTLGDNCKLQNYALVYEPATLEDGVFVGPAAVFTNDQYPRSVTPDGALKSGADWTMVGVTCREGASIGARAVCVAPVTVGRWALVAAGSGGTRVVRHSDLVAGDPAGGLGWVGWAGHPLEPGIRPGTWVCPITGHTYTESDGTLTEDTQ